MPDPSSPVPVCIGIDISKDSFDVCVLHPDGQKSAKSFANVPAGFEAFLAWNGECGSAPARLGVEATGPYALELLYFLCAAVPHMEVALLNPRHVKNYGRSLGRRVKTDRVDAEVIAHFIRSVPPRRWTPPPVEIRELQSLMRRRAQLVAGKLAARNRLQSLGRKVPGEGTEALASVRREIAFLDGELKRIEEALTSLLRRSVVLKKAEALLRTVPGIGRVVALTILAEVPFIASFGRAREVAAFAGVTPALQESGTSVRRRGRLSKEGSSALRTQLYMAALNVARRDNPLRSGYEAFVKRGKPKMVALGATMHRLLRIAYGVLKHETPFTEAFLK